MKIVEYNYKREVKASYESIIWNYFDLEHLYVVHNNYTDAKVFYEDDRLAGLLLDYKLPIFSFLKSHSLNVVYMSDKNTIKVFNTGLFNLISETTIKVFEVDKNNCKLEMNYKFFLKGWLKLLKPFLGKMTQAWNKKVWDEDLNLKLRRTKVLKNGFKDFHGMESKFAKNNDFKLPVRRHINSPVNIKK
tara:strand:+ start:606 stop:1172 length:567 start_codon:yes stop_codon:yes gene_type:complete